jgi:hypothetical protein
MCHGTGSLRRMNPDATSENETDNNESSRTIAENNTGTPKMEVVTKDNLEILEKTRKNKT